MSNLSVAEAASNCSEPEGTTCAERAALYRPMHRHGMTDIANQEVGALAHPPRPLAAQHALGHCGGARRLAHG